MYSSKAFCWGVSIGTRLTTTYLLVHSESQGQTDTMMVHALGLQSLSVVLQGTPVASKEAGAADGTRISADVKPPNELDGLTYDELNALLQADQEEEDVRAAAHEEDVGDDEVVRDDKSMRSSDGDEEEEEA